MAETEPLLPLRCSHCTGANKAAVSKQELSLTGAPCQAILSVMEILRQLTYEDEVIFVHKGAVRIMLDDVQSEAGTGATVFIPTENWIGVQNASTEAATILFFFNKPAFENCLRATSSRPGAKLVHLLLKR